MKPTTLGSVAIALLMIASIASATSVIFLEAEELFGKAEAVFYGEVTGRESVENPGGMSTIVTDVTVKIEKSIKGNLAAAAIVRVPGGRIGEKGLAVSGTPEFEVGDRVLLAVDKEKEGRFMVRGFFQGRFSLVPVGPAGELWVVQDPWRKIVASGKKCDGNPDECFKDARIRLKLSAIRKLCGAAE
jgi:hypothetical protein